MNAKPLVVLPRRNDGESEAPPNNLPAQLTSLVGREEELSALQRLLLDAEVRLVTLMGPGGVGKTRLALQVAEDLLEHYQDGVFFVDLTFITQAERVLSTIAQVLGIKAETEGSTLEALAGHLRSRTTLLLMDNFEQVLDAAPHIAELLRECPQVKILVTSRAALHIRGEHEFQVQPLSLPARDRLDDPAAISQSPAVTLFVKRAVAIRHDFALTPTNAGIVAQICARLDGLPLALELAATQVKALTPQAMLARLDHRLSLLTSGTRDMPARHQTLRAAIDWSYSLLPEDEKRLFRLVSGFAGGAALDAVEAVARRWPSTDGGRDERSVLVTVGALIDKSLLRQTAIEGEPRYSMLETLREYGIEQLTALREMEDLRRAHAEYYLALAEELEPDLGGPKQGELLDRLEQEHDNMRAALSWATTKQETELALRLCVALWWFWRVRGHGAEGRRWLETALAMPNNVPEGSEASAKIKLQRIHSHNAAGVLAYEQGDYEQAIKFHEGTLALGREMGRLPSIAAALNNLGLVARAQGDYLKAHSLYEESLEIRRKIGIEGPDHKWNIAINLNNLGVVAVELGDYEVALALHEDGLALRREVGDKRGIAMGMHNLGYVLALQGRYEEARAMQDESLGLNREIGDKWGMAYALNSLGQIDLSTGDLAGALENYTEAVGLRMSIGDKEGIADTLDGLASVAAATGQNELAARLLGTAGALRDGTGLHIAPTVRNFYERILSTVRDRLGERHFKAAWHEGRGMSPEQVLASESVALVRSETRTDRKLEDTPTLQSAGTQATLEDGATPSQAEFAAAVQEALRHLGRAAALEDNLLARSRVVSIRAGGDAGTSRRVSTLQTLVKEAVATLQASPRDLKLYRAMFHTYLQPAPTQEQAAELLDLPFSTYRRHLKEGIARVAETLWQWEREARESG